VLSVTNTLQILNDVRTDLNNVRDTIDLDWNRMQELENRLNEILRIKNKYRMEIPELLDYLEEMKLYVNNYSCYKEKIESLKDEISILSGELKSRAEQLSLDRKNICKQLRQEIVNDISRLAIPEGDFGVVFNDLGSRRIEDDILDGYDETGKDRVEFLFSANKGVPLQPLKNAISGGELSRLLLVIKKQLAGRLDTFSLVFDEIDSGIGGKTANHLGEFMAQAGRYHQVLCITHLSQIAAHATKHFLIEKKSSSDKSFIEIKTLTEQRRKEEIARMLAGSKSETALKHAEELLNKN
jgi:DNA repair protein RecN (Recombination protein N)